jgi:hypothetical protein
VPFFRHKEGDPVSDELPSAEQRQPLSSEERKRLSAWYDKYGALVVRAVRQELRAWAAGHAAGHSAVAQSVWRSIAEHHVDEMMKVDPRDNNSAESLLLRVACKHCWKPNKAAQRHPAWHLEDARAGPERVGFDPQDEERAVPPLAAAITRELEALLASIGGSAEGQTAARALARVEGGIELIGRLSDRQRRVLALKIAGRKRPEIAADLDLDLREVDRVWKDVSKIAEETSD